MPFTHLFPKETFHQKVWAQKEIIQCVCRPVEQIFAMTMSRFFLFGNNEILLQFINPLVTIKSKKSGCSLIVLEKTTVMFLCYVYWQFPGQLNRLLLVPSCAVCTVTKRKYIPRFTSSLNPNMLSYMTLLKGED